MSIKAQTLSYDFFIATFLLFLFLALIFLFFYYRTKSYQENSEKIRANELLFSSSEIWFKEGHPKYWNESNVVEIGLSNDGKINLTKVKLLENLGYSKVVSLLNLGTWNVKYSLLLQNGTEIFSFPSNEIDNAKDLFVLERIGILEDKPVIIRTILWLKQ